MLCADTIGKLIKDEIKFNVCVCNVKPDWLKDKEAITLDAEFKLIEKYPLGTADAKTLRANKRVRYFIIRNKHGMYLSDTHDGHQIGAYRTRQTAIWDYYSDLNKLGEDWWLEHLKFYGRRFVKYKGQLKIAETYLAELERWLGMGLGTNHFTKDIENEFRTRIETVKVKISELQEEIDERESETSESTDTVSESS